MRLLKVKLPPSSSDCENRNEIVRTLVVAGIRHSVERHSAGDHMFSQ